MSRRAKCRCGGSVTFCTDLIGRTVEQCDGECRYHGIVRPVATTPPPTLRSRRCKGVPKPYDPHRYRCGHPRTPENSAQHKLGWSECRECSRTRAKRSRSTAA